MKKIKFFLTFCLFILVPIFVSAQNLPRVLISEVYYNPDESHKIQNKEGWFEWIEIINIDDTPVDLNGWKICDPNSCDVLTHSVFLVYPQEKVLILPTSTILNFWPNISSSTKQIVLESPIGGWGLNDNGERITLVNQDGEIIDELCYGKARGCTNLCPAIPEGYSLERNFLIGGPRCQFFPQSAPNPGTYTFEKYWHKFIFDPLEEVPLDIFSGFLIYGKDETEENEILSFLPSEHPIPLGCKVLVGKISWKTFDPSNLLPYSGVGIKLENLTTHEIYLLSYEISLFSQYLLYSPDDGSSWEIIDDASFFIYFLDSPEILYFGVNLDELSSSLNWKINFISGRVDPNTLEYKIFDQTKEILLKGNRPPVPIINFSPTNPVKGVEVKFDASLSDDPDGEITKFQWQIGTSTFSGTTTEFTFNENEEYQVTLTATDNDGATSSTSTIIKVEPFSFAIITDLHIGRGYPDYDGPGFDDSGYSGEEYYLTQRLRNVVNWINQNKENYSFKFVAVLGDIADTAEKSEFCKAKEILDQLEIPYIPLFGNHDVWPYTEKEPALGPLGEDFCERIFWPTTSIPCENASSTRNFEILLREFNFERDIQNPKFKNFIFNYGGINFIGLDFNSREKACGKECGVKGEGVLHNQTINWLKSKLNEWEGEESVIIFSHEPFAKPFSRGFYKDSVLQNIIPFPQGNFSGEELEEINQILQDYENISEGQRILGDFGGHIHGFEKLGKEIKFFGQFSPIDVYFDANWQYPSLSTVPVLTTEALMVGGNEKNLDNKGLVRIVKIEDKEKIDFSEIEFKKPALNPYIAFDYKILPDKILPCVRFVGNYFSKREPAYFIWDFGDGEHKKLFPPSTLSDHCYSPLAVPATYIVTFTVVDKETGTTESITRKIEIKEGIIPKIIKIGEDLKDKVEFISAELGERVTEFGRTMRDWVWVKVKHSPSTPVGLINVHFEETTGEIDLSQLKTDVDFQNKKSLLYMPQWPSEIERSKILFVPK